MKDDRDNDDQSKNEPHEEGEYHFSDEDVTYEAEAEHIKSTPTETPKESVFKQFTQRRLIISVVIFLILVFAIYKMLTPSSTVPSTDITPAPVAQMTPPVTTPPTTTITTLTPPTQESTPAPVSEGVSKEQFDQFSASVQSKFDDLNTANQTLQTQVQELDTQLNSLQTKLNQLIQMLQQSQTPPPVPVTTGNPFPAYNSDAIQQSKAQQQVVPPVRLPYSVQAIIPGRAWLKSDSGDTITVAEGDSIRELGRIIKIDPYDGVVVVNTGNRVVSLSYGSAS